MKIATCQYNNNEHLGLVIEQDILLLEYISPELPKNMNGFLAGGENTMNELLQIQRRILEGDHLDKLISIEKVKLLAPVPRPTSFRDAYAFRQHVSTSRRNRGLDMISEFDQFPVFYFSNHQAIVGPGDVSCMPLHFERMDFELEVAVVINKQGKNISASKADDYIAGYMVMNDLSARKLQMEEMKLNLGPAKGKDFATAIGPWLVTKDELDPYKDTPPKGHIGNVYKLEMTCRVNDMEVSRGNLADMHWTFAEIIERVSYGVDIYPGDIIGSGTVGTGCFLELNGTGKLNNPNYQEQWLQPSDKITLEVTGLGQLTNKVLLDKDFS